LVGKKTRISRVTYRARRRCRRAPFLPTL